MRDLLSVQRHALIVLAIAFGVTIAVRNDPPEELRFIVGCAYLASALLIVLIMKVTPTEVAAAAASCAGVAFVLYDNGMMGEINPFGLITALAVLLTVTSIHRDTSQKQYWTTLWMYFASALVFTTSGMGMKHFPESGAIVWNAWLGGGIIILVIFEVIVAARPHWFERPTPETDLTDE